MRRTTPLSTLLGPGRLHPLLLGPLLLAGTAGAQAGDFVVRSGETVAHPTLAGPIVARDIHVEVGGVLQARGPRPLVLIARRTLRIDGRVTLTGFSARDVTTLGQGNVPVPGGRGVAGGGDGGTASWVTTSSTPAGRPGDGPFGRAAGGGGGGESGYAAGETDNRRPGGGGGGSFATEGTPGRDGNPRTTGALSGTMPAAGGAAGAPAFVDGDPSNDFWGLRLDAGGALVQGELRRPRPGCGGGAGGDAIPGRSFPSPNWNPDSDERGGGGGAGLGFFLAHEIVFGPNGNALANGGEGGLGESTAFENHVGGSGGGGTGGMLVLQAGTIDLRQAGRGALQARGGSGARGARVNGQLLSAGGRGGAGLIQLHAPSAADVLLPPGLGVEDLSQPDAWVLLPFSRNL